MMFTIAIVCASILLLLGLSAALLARPLRAEADFRAVGASQMELLSVNHFVNCRQVSRALADDDFAVVRDRLPKPSSQRMRTERRALVRLYVMEIGRDFARIDRLARIVASLSPKVDRQQETERFRLELQFRCVYRLVLLRLSAGGQLSAETLTQLADMVGILARRVEGAMAWNEAQALGQEPLGA